MSRTPSTPPHDAPLDDTPPHGVPPVSRAAIASRPPRRDGDGLDLGGVDLGGGDFGGVDLGGGAQDFGGGAQDFGEEGANELGPDGDGRRDGPTADVEVAGETPVPVPRQHAGRSRPRGSERESPSRRRGRLTRRGRMVAGVLAVLLVGAGVLAWYEVESNPFGPPGATVLVDVQSGEPLTAITAALAKEGVIGTTLAFHLWSFVHGSPVVLPGTYQLHRNLSFSAAKSALDAGPNVSRINVVAGTTVSELANELASLPGNLAHTFSNGASASGVHSPFQLTPTTPLEGLLGTGSYRILPGESGRTLLTKMVDRFDTEARSVGLTPTETVGGLNAYQLVTLASIAQKEGYFTRYMGDVARVIYNRLADGMHLDMTSTVLYSLGKDGGKVTPQEEQLTTPYNTYLHAGLTPTPICTPSVQALAAAVHPPAGAWLYFDLVTAKNSIMKFATTYTQQLALIREARKNASSSSTGGSGT